MVDFVFLFETATNAVIDSIPKVAMKRILFVSIVSVCGSGVEVLISAGSFVSMGWDVFIVEDTVGSGSSVIADVSVGVGEIVGFTVLVGSVV